VPDHGLGSVVVKDNMTYVIQYFEYFFEHNDLQCYSTVDSGFLVLTVEGNAVLGIDQTIGVTAGIYLINFLASFYLDNNAQAFV
ncbi:dipeptidase PepV, partial [Staphylococcus aureus]|nr:dipeptidase PepV [Staphylococcus aureus]